LPLGRLELLRPAFAGFVVVLRVVEALEQVLRAVDPHWQGTVRPVP
jgi:hypothetical protein